MNNRYFLMRHGESLANLADKIISSPETGCQDYGLSVLGQEQARRSAEASGLGPDTHVLSSDFLRTRQTAEIAARVLGCAPPAWKRDCASAFSAHGRALPLAITSPSGTETRLMTMNPGWNRPPT